MSRKAFFITIGIALMIIIALFLFPITFNGKRASEYLPPEVQKVLPFGRISERNPNEINGNENQNTSNTTTDPFSLPGNVIAGEPILRKLYDKPVAGSIILERKKEFIEDKIKKVKTEYFVRFVDRATGHILEANIQTGEIAKISNTTIPQVYEALWNSSGNYFIGRMLDDDAETIKTLGISLRNKVATTTTASSTPATDEVPFESIVGTNFETNIKEMALSYIRNNVLFLTYGTNGGIITLSGLDRSAPKQIFSNILREWQLHLVNGQSAVISTKPTSIAKGFAYILNLSSGALTKLAGGKTGLTVLPSRSLALVLVGEGNSALKLSILDTAKKTEVEAPFETIPEKCVWGKAVQQTIVCGVPVSIPNASYPDSWYQGKISFNDDLWIANVSTGESRYIASPERIFGEEVDTVSLDVSSDDRYVSFINKKDLSLWSAKIIFENKKEESTFNSTTTPPASN